MAFSPDHPLAAQLLFLAAGLVAGGGAVLFVGLMLSGRPRGALRVVGTMVGVGLMYATGLASSSLASRDVELGPGEAKYFCEIDCHLAVVVEGVEVVERLGTGGEGAEAEGRFWVVTVRAWFDGRTVSSRRPAGAPLVTPPRRVTVVDGSGRSWRPSAAGHAALGVPPSGLDAPLLPGQSVEARYVFDLPADVQSARLLVEARSVFSRFMIGHENSPLHGKVLFRLEPGS